ncbi:MAG: UDP-N-acetylmuramoyl-tripeptide--D-alanyl-D-alanine ligase [Solirubrobacterales bacterium]|nr:UDP-N-acetylmuramoyl-tripeptide--D-alanyl-D-alanine ligase [Solirubrobacterales bacterium]MBV9918763.1 UDP-N-acetylmuramoyl-tripeptide--D-alanyl-D-alanine ligase [Solirubrobacterales bacterium]
MLDWTPEQLARAAGARVVSHTARTTGPERVVIDSREAGPGTLFVGLRGAQADGGRFAAQALANGAWGALTTPEHAEPLAGGTSTAALLSATDPLKALQALATAWRRELGARVIGVTGSTGKTTTKDLLLALLAPHRRTVASRANFNTEIGVPLEILAAPASTEVLVLEMAMRGAGQIAELASIAEPDVAVIVSIGPVHLELLGSIEAIAAAKAELIQGLPRGGTAIVPAGERLLEPHLRDDVTTVTFGPGGDVRLVDADGEHVSMQSAQTRRPLVLEVPFTQAHMRTNLLAAVAASEAVGVTPSGRVEVALSPGRGQRFELPGGVTLIDDCYNANPMSMRAALDDLASSASGDGDRRRVAVLGDMLELGPAEREFHVELGAYADCAGVELLVTVGELAAAIADGFGGETHVMRDAGEAAAILPELVEPGDVVLVKASRGVGLELVCGALGAEALA